MTKARIRLAKSALAWTASGISILSGVPAMAAAADQATAATDKKATEEVSAEMLSLSGADAPATHEPSRDTGPLPRVESPSIVPFRRQEQRIIEEALRAFGGNAQKAAAALEVAPSTIYRKLQSWAREKTA